MRQFHYPVWLGVVATTGNPSFVVLFVLETFTRAILVTVVPLQALALLGDAQGVSSFYFSVSAAGLLGALAVPWLVRRLRRRRVTRNGCVGKTQLAPARHAHLCGQRHSGSQSLAPATVPSDGHQIERSLSSGQPGTRRALGEFH